MIGVQVLENCWYEIRKILPLSELYPLTSRYIFDQSESKRVTAIRINSEVNQLKWRFKREGIDDLQVNVSAIVGKNGSGKSTILELFYAFCLCISKEQFGIKTELVKLHKQSPSKWRYIEILSRTLHVEFFFEADGIVKSIQYNKEDGIKCFVFNQVRTPTPNINLEEFCYTIAINYSLHGLNEENSPWLTPMFHKNDGYQAPLVINPYREAGNIDVNSEYNLVNSRLLHNISVLGGSSEILNGQLLSSVEFSFDPRNLDTINYQEKSFDLDNTIRYYESTRNKSIYELFNRFATGLTNKYVSSENILEYNKLGLAGSQANIDSYREILAEGKQPRVYIEFWFIRYVIKKVFKTCLQYSWFRTKYIKPIQFDGGDIISIPEEHEDELVRTLLDDRSHTTLKLRQTINVWSKRYFAERAKWGTLTHQDKENEFSCHCKLTLHELNEAIGSFDNRVMTDLLLERIPGGILKPKIKVNRIDSIDYGIKSLSSGEQQLVFTIQTILYHLNNINSVFRAGSLERNNVLKYRYVLIVLDEIELYFHPEFQRTFINELIRQVLSLKIPHILSIHFLFSTHSPFILSDIHGCDVIRLENGKISKHPSEETFASNVHDMLANEFYLRDGFMGERAKGIIQDLIHYLTSNDKEQSTSGIVWSVDTSKALIKTVGESILRNRLERLWEKKFIESDKELIKKRIKELEVLLNNEKDKNR